MPSANSQSRPLAAIVLAAGQGTRMKSAKPKVLHEIAGRSLIGHVLATLGSLQVDPVVVVIGPDMAEVAAAVPFPTVVQKSREGTGHAVLQACDALKDFSGDVLVVYGDTPLVSAPTYERMRMAGAGHGIVVLGFTPDDPGDYGRLILGPDGLERIVEAKDASAEQRQVRLCNSGIMLVDSALLWRLLPQVNADNAKREYYLTDIVGLARRDGVACAVVDGASAELMGINSRAELAAAEQIVQQRLRTAAMAEGATLRDPATVFFCMDTRVGRDVEIGPFTVFGPGVSVADSAVIKGFCHIEGAHIAAGAIVGPFARLRPGAKIGPEAHIGNFVEVKNATLERGAKANHLAYVGDASVGAEANIGAGTITANYDGFTKNRTDIGAHASIGSNSVLVAPVKIGEGAMTGAGAVVVKDVPADALAVNSARQEVRDGFASEYRERKRAAKKAKASQKNEPLKAPKERAS